MNSPHFLISGLINIETTLRVDAFPLEYFPVTYPFHGVHTTVSGVGANVALALRGLGAQVKFASIVGNDGLGDWALRDLSARGLDVGSIRRDIPTTAQSVILYDGEGRRQIHVDLKELQEIRFSEDVYRAAVDKADWVVACNINFTRPLLDMAKTAGKPVATDVHTLSDPRDEYNRDYLQGARVLFLSDEKLWALPEEAASDLMEMYPNIEVVVIGMGASGAFLNERSSGTAERFPAVFTRPVINTIGAGDALFSAFLIDYARTGQAESALRRAMVYASYKAGAKGAADGLLNETEWTAWCERSGVFQ